MRLTTEAEKLLRLNRKIYSEKIILALSSRNSQTLPVMQMSFLSLSLEASQRFERIPSSIELRSQIFGVPFSLHALSLSPQFPTIAKWSLSCGICWG